MHAQGQLQVLRPALRRGNTADWVPLPTGCCDAPGHSGLRCRSAGRVAVGTLDRRPLRIRQLDARLATEVDREMSGLHGIEAKGEDGANLDARVIQRMD